MDYLFERLTSRKFWLAIAGVATGIYTVLGGDGSDISTISGAVVSLVSAMTYIITEGKIDAAAVATAIESAQEVVETLEEETE